MKTRTYRLIINGVPLMGSKKALFAVIPLSAIEAWDYLVEQMGSCKGIATSYAGRNYQLDLY